MTGGYCNTVEMVGGGIVSTKKWQTTYSVGY
nr:MAG TPA: hypothetical protein [Caudoviricetes sp.]